VTKGTCGELAGFEWDTRRWHPGAEGGLKDADLILVWCEWYKKSRGRLRAEDLTKNRIKDDRPCGLYCKGMSGDNRSLKNLEEYVKDV